MTATFFTYKVGTLEVLFEQGNVDFINFKLRLHGDTTIARDVEKTKDGDFLDAGVRKTEKAFQEVECRFASSFCPFDDFVTWLEAVILGVQECAFAWEGEGPYGSMRWHRRDRDTGHFTLEWSRLDGRLRIMLGRYQMVEAFYSAFRHMADSPAYDPRRYEAGAAEADADEMGFGADLRQLRSKTIEDWLADAKNIPSGNKEITGEVH